jgi:DNA ligase D-like protein (predicted 3'-phosphoesterase)
MAKKSPGNNVFVIHEHHARNLHWDFRLAMDGVLKSWAIPKEPPILPGVKRLAIQTEDHSMDYADFEGEIPEGEYGAGMVKVWDRGTYEPESMHENKIVIILKGKKLKGAYILLKFRPGKEKNMWLFFKRITTMPKALKTQ